MLNCIRHLLLSPAIPFLLSNSHPSSACSHHHPLKRSQPSATQPLTPPTRELEWGDLNIIHTTDTHGWLLGHLKSEYPEPNYSGDFGDFLSFVLRMKQKAKKKNVDLLIVDTGDLHDGNGLTDAEPLVHPTTPRGTSSGKFFARVPYDVLAIGNHELYDLSIAQDMHDNFAPVWGGSYLTSNVNITTSGQSVPIGSRYRKFKTTRGRRVTAFGIIFHFTGNAKGTIVQPPAELVLEPWFKEAIKERPDVFLLTGHMAITDADWKIVFAVIRQLHPKVPIIILGGHLHIRDCRQLDDRSMSLASGRYMETIGWMSVQGLDHPHRTKFSRRYLDPNRKTYAFHAGQKFDTRQGLSVTRGLAKTAEQFNITYRLGTAPQSFFGYRLAPNAKNSLNYLFAGPHGVLETIVRNPDRPHAPLIIINTGALRFDVLAGNFTVNDEFITMPFANTFGYVRDVPRAIAERLLAAMNVGGAARSRSNHDKSRRNSEIPGEVIKGPKYHLGQDVEEHYRSWLELQSNHQRHTQSYLRGGMDYNDRDEIFTLAGSTSDQQNLNYGYVTRDQCPGIGDDVIHKPLPTWNQPDYIGTSLPPSTDKIDVVFFSFITSFALAALNKISSELSYPGYSEKDVEKYTELRSNQILGLYARKQWNN